MRHNWKVIVGAGALLAAVVAVAWVLNHFLEERWAAFIFSLLWIAFGIWAYADSHSKRARERKNRELRERGYGFLADKDDEK